VAPDKVQEVFFGNVLSAGMGQAPARQAALKAGIPNSTDCTTINKVCASGMKALMFGTQAIQLGYRDIVVAGGMESMSNVPYYLPKARSGYRLGHQRVLDGVVHDGLWDIYHDCHMGIAGEKCASKYSLDRKQQDDFAIASYKRAQEAQKKGYFKREITPVTIPGAKGGSEVVVSEDEEPGRVKFDQVSKLAPAFQKDGSVTAANSSVISDGAAALVLMSRETADRLGIKPLAVVKGYGDAAVEPLEFPIAPALAIPNALKNANVSPSEVDAYEINEAFSVVVLANMKLLNIPHDKMNVWGGAVSLGHPIGCSGARIICTLLSVLLSKASSGAAPAVSASAAGATGVAAICNGGGGASAVVIQTL